MAVGSKSVGTKKKGVTTTSKVTKKVEKKASRPEVTLPELNEFLEAGAHFGHRTSRWDPKMAEYIYTAKDGVHIIDVVQTTELLAKALKAIQEASDEGGILIVGTKGQAANMVQKVAEESGAFFINNRWPGGLFTNFDMIKKSVRKLVKMEEQLATGATDLVKKEQLMLARDVARLNRLYEGIKFMEKLPRLVIVIDSRVEKGSIKEAMNAGVQVAALLDTNCDPEIVSYPVPANDDSIKSITLFLELFGKAIKGGKKTDGLLALRKTHRAQLANMAKEYADGEARAAVMEAEERERMKTLRSDPSTSTPSTSSGALVTPVSKGVSSKSKSGGSKVVRIVKKDDTKVSAKKTVKKIDDLEISSRAKKALDAAGYKDESKLKGLAKSELTAIKGIGEKAAEEIMIALKQ